MITSGTLGRSMVMLDFETYLIAQHPVDADTLARARAAGEKQGLTLAEALITTGAMSDRDFAASAADFLALPLAGPADIPSRPVAAETLPARFLSHGKCLPLGQDETTLTLAMVDPFDETTAKAAGVATGCRVARLVIGESHWSAAMAELYGRSDASFDRLSAAFAPATTGAETVTGTASDTTALADAAAEAPVIQMVNLILERAARMRASDIHLEPFEREFKLRYRVDGILLERPGPPPEMTDAITSRLKILARLNIAERRLPQDGRFSASVDGREVDIRMSTVPTVHGESLVLRVLDQSRAVFDFASLGLAEAEIDGIKALLDRPTGMILTTGPTGSGKTTSLYAALSHLNDPGRKIVSIEDPVEYQIDRINQIPVHPAIGLGFASLLRNVLRQDPDVIMIGEMRDAETAEIAMRAAMTGHMVLSTAHTNSALGAIIRLRDMGIASYVISATLNAVMAQRLVRRLCPDCAGTAPITAAEAAIFGDTAPARLPVAVGCEACAGTGYLRRIGLFEIIRISPALAKAIADGLDEGALSAIARAEGQATLLASGLARVRAGQTTLSELARVVGLHDG